MKYKNLYMIRGEAVKSDLEDLKKTDYNYKKLVKNSPYIFKKSKIILDTIEPRFKINDLCAKHQCPTKCAPCGSKNLINSVNDLIKYLKTQKGETDFSSKYKLKLPKQTSIKEEEEEDKIAEELIKKYDSYIDPNDIESMETERKQLLERLAKL